MIAALLPDNISSYGGEIDRLFRVILWITGIVFVLVQGLLVAFLIWYRRRPGRTAHYTHGNTALEIVWTVIPALILVWLTFASQRVWAHVRGTPPAAALEIEVLAEQFAWNIRYPGPDGFFETADDVTTINQMHVPVGEPVLITLKSKDVIHSLFMPLLRVKHDAVPGLPSQLWFQATEARQLEIACAELCGLGHYRMRGFVTVETRAAFDAWMAEQVAATVPAAPSEDVPHP